MQVFSPSTFPYLFTSFLAHHSLSPDPMTSSASSEASLALLPTPSPPRSFHAPLANPTVSQGDYWSQQTHNPHYQTNMQWPPSTSNKRSWDWGDEISPAQRQMDQFLNDLKKRRVEPSYDSRKYSFSFFGGIVT